MEYTRNIHIYIDLLFMYIHIYIYVYICMCLFRVLLKLTFYVLPDGCTRLFQNHSPSSTRQLPHEARIHVSNLAPRPRSAKGHHGTDAGLRNLCRRPMESTPHLGCSPDTVTVHQSGSDGALIYLQASLLRTVTVFGLNLAHTFKTLQIKVILSCR